jgi:hypothetical protein
MCGDNNMRPRYCILLLLLAHVTCVCADEQDMAFQKSRDLLEVDMKLRILGRLRERGLYIPAERVRQYAAEKRELASELGMAAGTDLEMIEGWAESAATVRKAEKESMLLVAEAWGKKILTAAVSDDKKNPGYLQALREWEQQRLKWRSDKTTTASAVAAHVEVLASRYKQDHLRTKWEENARRIYRGTMKERGKLVDRVIELDGLRLANEASLATLKTVRDQLGRVDLLQKLKKDPTGTLMAEAEKEVFARLTKRYPDANMANITWAWGKAKGCFSDASTAYGKVSELDSDPGLKAFPQARQTAKGFAVMASVYKNTLGVVKDLEIAKPLGPFIDVLEFYGEGMNLVPTVAQKVSKALVSFGRDPVNRTGAWVAVYDQTPHDNLFRTDLRHFTVEIATPQTLPDGAAQTYYLLLPKDISRDGYEPLNQQQYLRLRGAIADERIASILRDYRGQGMLSSSADEDVVKAVRTIATKTPFNEVQQLTLAHEFGVEYRGTLWSAPRFAERADTEIDLAVREMILRESLHRYTDNDMVLWRQFCATVESYDVAFAPDRFCRLFNFFASGGSRAILERRLKKLARERAKRRLGTPTVGVPSVEIPPDNEARAGEQVVLRATVIVGGLAPGRTVEADIIWLMPDWARSKDALTSVTLKNGLNPFERKLNVPANVVQEPFEVEVGVEVRPGPYDEKPVTAGGIGYFSFGEPETGESTIVCRRRPGGGSGNQILVRSEMLAGIDRQPASRALRLRLYYAYDADGPWTEAEDSSRDIEPDDEVDPQGTLIEADRALLSHSPGTWHKPEDGAPRPLHYRVGFQWFEDDRALGDERFSESVGPGRGIVILPRGAHEGDPVVSQRTSEGDHLFGWLRADVQLGIDNQDIAFWDAHFTLSTDGWTGHFWSPRSEGENAFGSTGSGYAAARARIRVPFSPKGRRVQIRAEAQGYSATAELLLQPTERDAKQARRDADSVLSDYSATSKKLAEGAARAGKHARETGDEFYQIRWQSRLDQNQKVSVPRALHSRDYRRAVLLGEWNTALAALTKRQALNPVSRELADRYATRMDQHWQKRHRREKDPAKLASKEAWRRKQLEVHRKGAVIGLHRTAARVGELHARVALLAGSAGELKKHAQAHVRAASELRSRDDHSPPSVARFLRWQAEAVALLTGDRKAAAKLLRQSYSAELAEGSSPPSRRVYLQPWLPPGETYPGQ